jgi:DNA-directed RNA polymerase alpha subunit
VSEDEAKVRFRRARRVAAKIEAELPASIMAGYPFRHRGLSERTIEALTERGIDAPERLLFMTADEVRTIPGIGKESMAEIVTYRTRFLPSTAAAR